MHTFTNKTNQILDFDERHCMNEYKSACVLRCRSTTNSISISKITNFKDKFFSEVYKNKAERICFCFAMAYARSLMFVLMLMSMLMAHASVDIFVLFYLVLIVMSINLTLKGVGVFTHTVQYT